MPKYEILPPVRSTQSTVAQPKNGVVTVNVPGISPRGAIDSYFDARRYGYTAKAANALTVLNNAEAALFDAQTRVVVAKTRRDDALWALQEAPERRAHELHVRRVQRANELREVQHYYEINEERRMKEVKLAQAEYVHAKATHTRAETDLVDAQQQLEAQRKHGALHYELAHAEQNLKRLDIRLSEEERRALLRRQLRQIEDGETEAERLFRDRLAQLSETDDSTTED